LAIAEAVLEVRLLAGGLIGERLELAPVVDDLVEPLLPPVEVAGTVVGDGRLPVVGGLRILPAILVNLRNVVAGLLALTALPASRDRAVDLDPVELVRNREALDAVGEAGDRLIVLERVQCEGAGFALLGVVVTAAEVAEVGHRLLAELAAEE